MTKTVNLESQPNGVYVPVADVGDTICLGLGDEKNLGKNCVITDLPKFGGCRLNEAGARLVGPAVRVGYVCRKCICNAHNAMCNRHGKKPPPVKATVNRASYASMRELAGMEYGLSIAYWWENWIYKWPLVKRLMIETSRVYDRLAPDRVKNMVKREVYHKLPTKARCIQYYQNLATQSQFGPEFYAIQKAYGKVCQRFEVYPGIRVTIATGMNANDLGRWADAVLVDIPCPMFYERDGKNWDASQQREHHENKMWFFSASGDQSFLNC